MSLFQEYESEIERDNDIRLRQFEIEIARFESEYDYHVSITKNEIMYEATTENNDKQKGKFDFVKFIKNIINSIIKFIQDMCIAASDIGKKDNIDIEAYLKSSTGQMELEYDMEATIRAVQDEILKGKKLVQFISKVTEYDDRIVNQYLEEVKEKITNVIKKKGKVIVKTAGSYAMYKNFLSKMNKTSKIVGDSSMQDAIEKCGGVERKETAVRSIVFAMQNMIKEGMYINTYYQSALLREAKREADRQKKEARQQKREQRREAREQKKEEREAKKQKGSEEE